MELEPVTPSFSWLGDAALRICFGEEPSAEALRRVWSAFRSIRRGKVRGLTDAAPAYTTLLLQFDLRQLEPEVAEREVRALLESSVSAESTDEAPLREIPVCYEPEFAPDLKDVAAFAHLEAEEVIARHCRADYRVAFLGFSPGFAYLTGLAREIAMKRLERPRIRVPAGSVGIAGDQTGIYPRQTPGGWRLIGRTPLTLFDAPRNPPSLLMPGDRVRFVRINSKQFEEIASARPFESSRMDAT